MASDDIIEFEMKWKLTELPGRNKLCDVMIHIGPKSFLARKDVLMLRMNYFRDMFATDDVPEGRAAIVELDPEIVDPAAFDDILHYVYTFKITLTEAKLESLYRAVDFFRFNELNTKIGNFIKDNSVHINMDNLPVIFDIAVKFNLKAQEGVCKRFILSNPLLSSKARPAVGNLDSTALSTLLQSQYNLAMFEEMFHSSMAWILHDEQNRSERLFDLLQKIPLDRLSIHFLNQVVSKNTIVKNDKKCQQLLLEFGNAIPPVEELYVFGGSDETQLSSMSKYSSTREWSGLAPMPSNLTHFAYCVANGKIYVCGGFNGTKNMNKLFMYDTNIHQWTTLKAMKRSLQGCAMAFLDGYLYVAGGNNHGTVFSDVKRYSIQHDKWENVPPMKVERKGLELIQMDGLLYALGGQNDAKNFKSVEQFNPQTGEWTALADMNYRHAHFGSAVLNGRIYTVGRHGCEEYNPQEDKWQIMASPTKCEPGRRLVLLGGKLHAIGGRIGDWNDWKGSKTVECYDAEKKIWVAAENMNIARCYHGVAVIKRTYTPQ